jgi:ABC-2 type transport system ATP-binding protein
MEQTTRASLEVRHLRVVYGTQVAVDDASFSVDAAEIFGLLGPNGAGKTSTLGAIEGLIAPRGGTVHVMGIDMLAQPLEARAKLGIQLQATSFQQDLTVFEIVKLYAGLYGMALSTDEVRAVIAGIDLEHHAKRTARQLSGGEQQRLALAVATLHDPPLVLLDEPTSGLDPRARRQLWHRVETMRDDGCGILLTTHSMEEARAICDRVAIIDHGKLIATDTPAGLIELHENDPAVRAAMRTTEATLEDVFIGLTGGSI